MKKTPLEKLREKERKARQKLLVDAAQRVFAAKPFPKVSMRDISRESGVSLSSIYRYFPDQESLFLAALVRGAQKAEKALEPLVNTSHPCPETVAETFVNFLVSHDPYFRMMTHFMLDGVLNPDSIQTLNRIEARLLDQFEKMFHTLDPRAEARSQAHAFFAALNGVLITYRNYPGREIGDVQRHMRQVARRLARMISTPSPETAPAEEEIHGPLPG